jgi:DNA-binding NtrC family response regulator
MADILVVDDQDRTAELCRRSIPEHRFHGPARSWREASERLSRGRRVDLVLLDVHFDIPEPELLGWRAGLDGKAVDRLRRRQGVEILKALRTKHPDLPVILTTSREELSLDDTDVAADETTYFLDDDVVDARSLRAQIAGIVEARRGEAVDGPIYWGESLAMRRLRQRLGVLSRGRLPVVLTGPTGTGKSLVARHFVHARSGRTGRFVAVDLATLPQDLASAHLFGSVRGAYTGSVADRTGAFEAADGGTLFLDEIGNLSMEAQKMLLSVLQEGVVTRLGDLKERAVDVKLVAATNEDLVARAHAGTFRSDLLMRLNPATRVELPPLAERGLDVGQLLSFCIEQALGRPVLRGLVDEYRERNRLGPGDVRVHVGVGTPELERGVLHLLFPDRATRLLKAHSWPGNLREFAMTAENLVLFALAEMLAVEGGDRPDVVQVRPRWVRELLVDAPRGVAPPAESGDGWRAVISVEPQDSLNGVSQACERQVYTSLYLEKRGDFAAMAQVLLGRSDDARKVQLRFNQLGLKVRDLKTRLEGG